MKKFIQKPSYQYSLKNMQGLEVRFPGDAALSKARKSFTYSIKVATNFTLIILVLVALNVFSAIWVS